jgi:hypothetical protein
MLCKGLKITRVVVCRGTKFKTAIVFRLHFKIFVEALRKADKKEKIVITLQLEYDLLNVILHIYRHLNVYQTFKVIR